MVNKPVEHPLEHPLARLADPVWSDQAAKSIRLFINMHRLLLYISKNAKNIFFFIFKTKGLFSGRIRKCIYFYIDWYIRFLFIEGKGGGSESTTLTIAGGSARNLNVNTWLELALCWLRPRYSTGEGFTICHYQFWFNQSAVHVRQKKSVCFWHNNESLPITDAHNNLRMKGLFYRNCACTTWYLDNLRMMILRLRTPYRHTML